jgi:hypothetical protein
MAFTQTLNAFQGNVILNIKADIRTELGNVV